MFPPGTPKEVISPLQNAEAVEWFHRVLPTLQPHAARLGMIEIVQSAGECVFVPGGWWHVVINLDFTVAGAPSAFVTASNDAVVTHNLSSPVNIDYVWLKCRDSRTQFEFLI